MQTNRIEKLKIFLLNWFNRFDGTIVRLVKRRKKRLSNSYYNNDYQREGGTPTLHKISHYAIYLIKLFMVLISMDWFKFKNREIFVLSWGTPASPPLLMMTHWNKIISTGKRHEQIYNTYINTMVNLFLVEKVPKMAIGNYFLSF